MRPVPQDASIGRRRRSLPVAALILAIGAFAWSGCGGGSDEQTPAPEASGEAAAPAEEQAGGRSNGQDGEDRRGAPSRGEGGGSQPSSEQLQEIRRRFQERREQASERIDRIRRIVEEVRSGERSPEALEELRERLSAGRDRERPAERFCRRPGAPERICERVREERSEERRERREEREERERGEAG